jgi:hypothetical protein
MALALGVLLPVVARAQGLTGALIGTVKDEQGGVLAGARVTVSSAALIGSKLSLVTGERGRLRFPSLPPGDYTLAVDLAGFVPYREEGIRVGAAATIDVAIILKVTGPSESVVVEGGGSRIEARDPGFSTRFSPADIASMPTRRASMFDFVRAAPGISPTSPSSGTATTVSAFGSGTNENHFLFDGTNVTCPCNGVARSEPGVDFIQEVQIQSVGASAEFGNMQGAVVNVITRQGGERLSFDAAYYGQTSSLTSQPVELPYIASEGRTSGYERAAYRDLTTSLGGPAIRNRLWFFGGYQQLRDDDSQPGTDPAFPRSYQMTKLFGKLTWRLAPGWQLVQSFHDEIGFNPDRPTIVTPFEATTRAHISVPAVTFGNLTVSTSPNTVWDLRAGRFVHTREDEPAVAGAPRPSRFDRVTGVTSVGPPRTGSVTITRTTAKATLTQFTAALFGADHQWKAGGQFEQGDHHAINVIPTGTRYEDRLGEPLQAISSSAASIGGLSRTFSAFVTDAATIGDRLTVTGGVRFDHSRAISQDVGAVDASGRETGGVIQGRGNMYNWNLWSPRLGFTARLTADGRTIMRASYGEFFQGVLTGEIEPFHPGATATTMVAYSAASGGYTGVSRTVDPKVNLQFDPQTRAPRTDEYSVGVDRALGSLLTVAIAYVGKDGRNFIGWTDTAGKYVEGEAQLADARRVTVYRLDVGTTPPAARRFLLANQREYALRYDGVVLALEKRRAQGWQVFGSYTWSRSSGLLSSSAATAAGEQRSTVSPPQPSIFGRDPNDLTNARGRLPNDRPHMLRAMGSADVPRTGLVFAASLQHFTGKPWTAAAQVPLPQGEQRILLEPRGSRRLSSQTLLDVRLSRPIRLGSAGRIELMLEVLDLLNDTAEESLATEVHMTESVVNPAFGRPASFVDPRRAVFGMRVNLGR